MTEGPEWFFAPIPNYGGADSEAWRNPLSGSSFSAEALLAREALQNSCDAIREKMAQVYVRITRTDLDGDAILAIKDALRIDDLASSGHWNQLGLKPGNALEAIASKSHEGVEVIVIEDFNTVGLGGQISGGKPAEPDHFKKLVLRLGSTGKSGGLTTQGSYGYGKSVYSVQSNAGTVVYYSAFKEDERTEGHNARLIAASLFDSHDVDGQEYDGRAFFGYVEGSDTPAPFTNDEAHEIAERIGLETRNEGELGTSLMIIGSNINMMELRKEIENYWWPKIIDQELVVELFDNETRLDSPAPGLRDDLTPFLKAYEFVNDRAEPDADAPEKKVQLQRYEDMKTGEIGLIGLPTIVEENEAFDNCVALLRRPKMVVQYFKVGQEGLPTVIGTFQADDDIDTVLKLSEPPAHDRWSSTSQRLEPEHNELVHSILGRIRDHVRRWQRDLAPSAPEEHGRLRTLEKMLAKLMPASGTTLPAPPPGTPDDFEIRSKVRRVDSPDTSHVAGEILVRIRAEAKSETMRVRLTPEVSILENENRSISEHVKVEISCEDPNAHVSDGHAEFDISKDSFASVYIQSDEVSADWILQVAERIETLDSSEASV